MLGACSGADALAVQSLPEFAGASTLLLRCVAMLGGEKGLQHSEAGVRQISVDLLGLVASSLCRDARLAKAEETAVESLIAAQGDPQASNLQEQLVAMLSHGDAGIIWQ